MTTPTLSPVPPPAEPDGLDLAAQLDTLAADRALIEGVAQGVYDRDQTDDDPATCDVMVRDITLALVEVGRRVRQAAAEYTALRDLKARVHQAAEDARADRTAGLARGFVVTRADVDLLDRVLAGVAL